MTKSPDAFRTISEVATWLGVQAHVLRFWESKFTQVKPVKRAGGRRYYRPADMRLIGGIKTLLHDDGMTIKGVQKILREQGAAYVSTMSPPLDGAEIEVAIDVEEPRGTVLAFKAKPGSPAASAPATARPKPEDSGAHQTALPLEESPRTAPTEAAEARAEPTAPESTPENTPESAPAPDHPALPLDLPPEPGLPSFLSPSAPPSPIAATQAPSRPQLVEAAAPVPETEPPYSPGALGHLAGMTAMTRDQAARIAPIARALRDWYDRQTKAGNG